MAIELTTGYVAGIVAFVFVLARLFCPTALAYIMASQLEESETAATWTVAAKTLSSSFWPFLLDSDAAQSHGVRPTIRWLSWSVPSLSILVAIAGVVTPLGLYEADTLSIDPEDATFRYLPDTSGFIDAMTPRGDQNFTRVCQRGACYVPCPYNGGSIVIAIYDEGVNCTSESVDPNVPQLLRDIYSSGSAMYPSSVSNFFDIEWRQLTKSYELQVNHGELYDGGAYRFLDAFMLDNDIRLVEGLVVDAKSGGVGLRNHTIPEGSFTRGVEWSEDILFLDVETECADTNLTIDFSITLTLGSGELIGMDEYVITDRGGFVNLNRTSPVGEMQNLNNKPDLQFRAYMTAWMTNVATVLALDAAKPQNESTPLTGIASVNSEIGKTFALPKPESFEVQDYLTLGYGTDFGHHLRLANVDLLFGDEPDFEPQWNITSETFGSIGEICEWTNEFASIRLNNTFVACNMMRGTPKRVDGRQGIVFDDGSRWSSPLYTCASAPKVTIKTVRFFINNTEHPHDLQSLRVQNITDKEYASDEEMPLWGLEDWPDLRLADVNPIWGLVDPVYMSFHNVSTLRAPSLYLPGSAQYLSLELISSFTFDNLPGYVAPIAALRATREKGDPLTSAATDGNEVLGRSSMKVWIKWKELSESAKSAGDIIRLIWTDLVASAIVGTKGPDDGGSRGNSNSNSRATGTNTRKTRPVFPTKHEVKYKYLFAIPAFVLAFCLVTIGILAALSCIIGKASIQRLDHRLKQTSVGRLVTSIFHPETSNFQMSSKEWSRENGAKDLIMSPETADSADVPEKKNNTPTDEHYARSLGMKLRNESVP